MATLQQTPRRAGVSSAWKTGCPTVKTPAVPTDVMREVCAEAPQSETWEGLMVHGADPATASSTARLQLREGGAGDVEPLLA